MAQTLPPAGSGPAAPAAAAGVDAAAPRMGSDLAAAAPTAPVRARLLQDMVGPALTPGSVASEARAGQEGHEHAYAPQAAAAPPAAAVGDGEANSGTDVAPPPADGPLSSPQLPRQQQQQQLLSLPPAFNRASRPEQQRLLENVTVFNSAPGSSERVLPVAPPPLPLEEQRQTRMPGAGPAEAALQQQQQQQDERHWQALNCAQDQHNQQQQQQQPLQERRFPAAQRLLGGPAGLALVGEQPWGAIGVGFKARQLLVFFLER